MTGQVVITHLTQDRPYVVALARHLAVEDIPVRWDPAPAGIGRGHIDECAALVVVLTGAAAASTEVLDDVRHARGAGKPILVLLLAPSPLPPSLRDCPVEEVIGGALPTPRFVTRLRTLTAIAAQRRPGPPTEPPFTARWPAPVSGGALRLAVPGNGRPVYAIAIARDASWFATGGEDGVVRLWDLRIWDLDSMCRAELTGHTDRIRAIAVTPNGSWVATAADDGRVRIWDPDTATCHATIPVGPTARIAIADDGTLFTVDGSDVRLWDLASRNPRVTLSNVGSSVTALAVARTGSWLATGDDAGVVRLWDLASARTLRSLRGPDSPVTALTISGDGARLAVCLADGTLRVWRRAGGETAATFLGPTVALVPWTPPVEPHDPRLRQPEPDAAWALAIAPDATYVVTAGSDRMTRVWETSTGDVRATFRGRRAFGRRAGTLAVAVAPDGSWIVTGDSDGTIALWDLTRT